MIRADGEKAKAAAALYPELNLVIILTALKSQAGMAVSGGGNMRGLVLHNQSSVHQSPNYEPYTRLEKTTI